MLAVVNNTVKIKVQRSDGSSDPLLLTFAVWSFVLGWRWHARAEIYTELSRCQTTIAPLLDGRRLVRLWHCFESEWTTLKTPHTIGQLKRRANPEDPKPWNQKQQINVTRTTIRMPFSQGGPRSPGSSERPLYVPAERRPARASLLSRVPAALSSKAPPDTGSSCPSFSPQTHPRPLGEAGLWPESAGLEPGWDYRSVGRTARDGKVLEVVRSGPVWCRHSRYRTESCCRFGAEPQIGRIWAGGRLACWNVVGFEVACEAGWDRVAPKREIFSKSEQKKPETMVYIWTLSNKL